MILLKDISFAVLWLWLVTRCSGYKRALTDYATPQYVSSTSSPSTLLIPTGQENVAAALLRASLMFDEEGLQYPYYDIQHNAIDKMHTDAYSGMQGHNGGHLQYYYQPTYNHQSEIVYGTAKSEEAENGLVYGRPKDRSKEPNYFQQNVNYNHNNYELNNNYAQNYDNGGHRIVYVQPIQHTREEYGRAIAYHQVHPQPETSQNQINYQQYQHIPSTAVYPTQPTYSLDFRPSEEYHEPSNNLQHLEVPRPSPSPTPKPQHSLDLLEKPHLSTTKQQALLTQYFKNIAAQNKEEEQVEEESKEKEEEEASRYKFGYRITDSVTGMEYGQAESKEGDMTRGHYHVLLPDGRMQHVHYWSDNSGYHATISYDDGPRQTIS